jgi:hypothetical protein
MSVAIVETSGNLVTVQITGKLRQSALAEAQKAMGEIIRQQGKVRLLIRAEHFLGWEQGDTWGDVSLQDQHDASIEKIAIVGTRQWEELALLYVGKGLRQVAIEYFHPEKLAQARAWLTT